MITRVQFDPVYRGNIHNIVIYADEEGAIDLRIWTISNEDPLIIPLVGHDACINPDLLEKFMRESERFDKDLPVVGRLVPKRVYSTEALHSRPRMDDSE